MATPEERLAAAVATAVAAANVDILAKISMMLAEKDNKRAHDDRGILDHKSTHNLEKFIQRHAQQAAPKAFGGVTL